MEMNPNHPTNNLNYQINLALRDAINLIINPPPLEKEEGEVIDDEVN